MNTFSGIVKNILGRFWLDFWQDSWLVQGLVYIYSELIYRVYNIFVANLYKQAAVSYTYLQRTSVPYRVLLRKQQTTKKAYKSVTQLSIGQDTLDQQTTQDLYVYDIVSIHNTPSALYLDPRCTGTAYTQFSISGDKLYTTVDFTSVRAKSVLYTQSDSIFTCHQLWGTSGYITPFVDTFSAIAKVPSSWAVLYPGAVQDAWAIRQFGATSTRVRSLLSKVCQCPVARISGIVRAIQNTTVFIEDLPHKCWSSDAILVNVGDRVQKGQPLCAYAIEGGRPDPSQILKIYSGTAPSQQIVPYIPVLTSAGVLYAYNIQKDVEDNALPLSGDSAVLQKYKATCIQRSTSTQVPYLDLPARVNPMKFLLQVVWRASGVLIVIPGGRNQHDMQRALSCILQNMPVGSVCIVYQLQSITEPVQLNLTAQNQILAYYTQTQKVSLYREINQWV